MEMIAIDIVEQVLGGGIYPGNGAEMILIGFCNSKNIRVMKQSPAAWSALRITRSEGPKILADKICTRDPRPGIPPPCIIRVMEGFGCAPIRRHLLLNHFLDGQDNFSARAELYGPIGTADSRTAIRSSFRL